MLYTTQELHRMLKETNEKIDELFDRSVNIGNEFEKYHQNWQIAMHIAYPNSTPKREYVTHVEKIKECNILLNCILTDMRMYNDQLEAINSMLREKE